MRTSTRGFARAAAVAFLLVTVYTVAFKAPSGELRDDWAHTMLHVVGGVIAAFAGWVARGPVPASVFSVAVAVGYGALGIMGWFVHTLFADQEFRIPLAPADNVFHVLLAAGAVAALAASSYGRRS
jgi:uncharacterized protein DUF4383